MNLDRSTRVLVLALALLPATLGAQTATPEVAPPFRTFYNQRQGTRVLGNPLARLETADSYYAQYFEKGLLEDHRGENINPQWQFMYARLGADLLASGSLAPVGGDTSDLWYAELERRAGAVQPSPSPDLDGPIPTARGVFVPFNAQLASAPGHYVTQRFWEYINRADLFPGGWLHDVGLPISEAIAATVTKGGFQRTIEVQAFERAILTYDAQNPADWQIERDNIGVDHREQFRPGWADAAIWAAINGGEVAIRDFSTQIERVEGDYARARVYPLSVNTDAAWIWLRREGNSWQVIGGPGTAFEQPFYDERGIPALLRVGNQLEQAMYDELEAWLPANTSLGEHSLPRMRIEAGIARVTVATPDGEGVLATAYLRLVDINRWQVLGAEASFDRAWFEQNGIPEVLW